MKAENAKLHIYNSGISDDIELSSEEISEILKETCSLAEMVVRKDKDYQLGECGFEEIVENKTLKAMHEKGDQDWDYIATVELIFE